MSVAGGLLAVLAQGAAGQPAASQPAGADRPAAASRPATQAATTTTAPAKLPLRSDPAGGLPTLSDGDRPGVLGQMAAYALLILALGGGALLMVRRYFPRPRSRQGGRLRVIDSVYIGPRKQVHVLEVGSQRFLLASCRDSVTMISELGSSFSELYGREKDRDGLLQDAASPLEDAQA
ncbi:MAG TPA: flagellar biosynthetic protein FliO [Phycisphaerae bacterium]|nr:flagellar biosynthetic protein FliO [Phycisphaerae bacterium]